MRNRLMTAALAAIAATCLSSPTQACRMAPSFEEFAAFYKSLEPYQEAVGKFAPTITEEVIIDGQLFYRVTGTITLLDGERREVIYHQSDKIIVNCILTRQFPIASAARGKFYLRLASDGTDEILHWVGLVPLPEDPAAEGTDDLASATLK